MKTVFTLIFTFSALLLFGQGRNLTGKSFITNVDIPVNKIDFFKNDSLSRYIAKANTKFTIIEPLKDDKIKIMFWKYKKGDTLKLKTVIYEEINKRTSTDQYFTMTLGDLDSKTQEYYGKSSNFTYGITLIPFKVRFGSTENFQYSEGFSLGLNAGYELGFGGRSAQSLSFLLGVAGSTVAVDSKSTNNFIQNNEITSTGAFTPSAGLVYLYERFQVGIFTGVDIVGGQLGKAWIYNKKPWLGLGVGFTVFQKNKTEPDKVQTQK